MGEKVTKAGIVADGEIMTVFPSGSVAVGRAYVIVVERKRVNDVTRPGSKYGALFEILTEKY